MRIHACIKKIKFNKIKLNCYDCLFVFQIITVPYFLKIKKILVQPNTIQVKSDV